MPRESPRREQAQERGRSLFICQSKAAPSAAVQGNVLSAFGVRRWAALWMMAVHVQFQQTYIRIST